MDNTKMISVLLSWTIHLTSYSMPDSLPQIEYKPHSFFIEHACKGKEKCRVAGWYNDNGVIFINENLKGNDDPVTRSLIVHELVHYLQDIHGKYNEKNCDAYMKREREAYSVQRQYLNRIANQFMAIYMNFPPCPDTLQNK